MDTKCPRNKTLPMFFPDGLKINKKSSKTYFSSNKNNGQKNVKKLQFINLSIYHNAGLLCK